MANNLSYYLGFSHFLGIGPMKFEALSQHFKNLKSAYNASESELRDVIGVVTAQKFIHFRNHFNPSAKLEECQKKQITILTQEDRYYPEQLKNISDPPICLYVKGNLKKFDFEKDIFFGIVGTRKPTFYGEQVTRKFASELVAAGFVIVSGMALGIDALAHKSAIDLGGRTIAFLGCGVDLCYPVSNFRLYDQIIKDGGLVISEFPPGRSVMKGLFVARNRLISGLSKGVLVVEGTKNSGSLITARYAGEQGKDVFAPPAPLTSIYSEAPNLLLKQGAKLVTEVKDILEEFNLRLVPRKTNEILETLLEDEKIIFTALLRETMLADDLALLAKLSISQILNLLSNLEIKGIVRKNKEGKYEINQS